MGTPYVGKRISLRWVIKLFRTEKKNSQVSQNTNCVMSRSSNAQIHYKRIRQNPSSSSVTAWKYCKKLLDLTKKAWSEPSPLPALLTHRHRRWKHHRWRFRYRCTALAHMLQTVSARAVRVRTGWFTAHTCTPRACATAWLGPQTAATAAPLFTVLLLLRSWHRQHRKDRDYIIIYIL